MLLEIKNGIARAGGQIVLSHFEFAIHGREKIAIVGRNGAGKTTLLHILSGHQDLDESDKIPGSGLFTARKLRIRILEQAASLDPARTPEEMLLAMAEPGEEGTSSRNPGEEHRDLMTGYETMLTRLGLSKEDMKRPFGSFSGGEQTKLMLISLFLRPCDVLLLDEPTNHLDLDTVTWLQEMVRAYPGAVVYVSHDRYFIDQTADAVCEVQGGQVVRYAGNYSAYRVARRAAYEKQKKAYEAQQEEKARLKGLIEKFRHKPTKASFARSRQKILDRMEEIREPVPDDAVIHTGPIYPARKGTREVLLAEHVKIGYDRPIHEIELHIRRGQKIGIFGPNGSGKTTLLKTLSGQIPPLDGRMQMGENIEVGYFDQMSALLSSEQNVFDYFHDLFPVLKGEEVRSYLAGFLFGGEDMGKRVSSLSGGEKSRLGLAVLLKKGPNFLILDEPTNHMDIPAMETLESIFRDYQGTIVFVSHDRYFLSRVASSLLIFGEGEPEYYPFGYDKYEENRARVQNGLSADLARTMEEQRLIEGLKNVPRKSHLPGELSTRQARLDWQFSLNQSAREEAEDRTRSLYEEEIQVPFSLEEYMHGDDPDGDHKEQDQRAQEAEDAWTRECLDYYDMILEAEESRKQ